MNPEELEIESNVELDDADALSEDLTDAEDAADDGEAPENESPDAEDHDEGADADAGFLTVDLGGDDDEDEGEEHQSAPFKALRQKTREQQKRIKELEREKRERESAQEQQELGERPTLAGCEYDDQRFEQELLAWNDRKRALDQQKEAEQEKAQAVQARYNERLAVYNTSKRDLAEQANIDSFDDVETEVVEAIGSSVAAVMIANSKTPALAMLALHKNPGIQKEIAEIEDPASRIWKLAQLDATMKVTGMKKKPAPERRMKNTNGSGDRPLDKLDRLRAQARETGDFTAVNQYKREVRKAQVAK